MGEVGLGTCAGFLVRETGMCSLWGGAGCGSSSAQGCVKGFICEVAVSTV